MTSLSYDTCRCYGNARAINMAIHDYTCPIRSSCARYQQKDNNLGPRTAIADLYCQTGNLTGFIEGESA